MRIWENRSQKRVFVRPERNSCLGELSSEEGGAEGKRGDSSSACCGCCGCGGVDARRPEKGLTAEEERRFPYVGRDGRRGRLRLVLRSMLYSTGSASRPPNDFEGRERESMRSNSLASIGDPSSLESGVLAIGEVEGILCSCCEVVGLPRSSSDSVLRGFSGIEVDSDILDSKNPKRFSF